MVSGYVTIIGNSFSGYNDTVVLIDNNFFGVICTGATNTTLPDRCAIGCYFYDPGIFHAMVSGHHTIIGGRITSNNNIAIRCFSNSPPFLITTAAQILRPEQFTLLIQSQKKKIPTTICLRNVTVCRIGIAGNKIASG